MVGRFSGLMVHRLKGEVRRIEIVLAGDPDQREQGIAPGIGQRRAHPMGSCRLAGRADRPVGGDPFAGGVDQGGRQLDQTGLPVDRRAWTVAISCWPRHLRTMSRPVAREAYRNVAGSPRVGKADSMVAVSDFSGFSNSAWALAKAAAILLMDLACVLHEVISDIKLQRALTDGSGVRPGSSKQGRRRRTGFRGKRSNSIRNSSCGHADRNARSWPQMSPEHLKSREIDAPEGRRTGRDGRSQRAAPWRIRPQPERVLRLRPSAGDIRAAIRRP